MDRNEDFLERESSKMGNFVASLLEDGFITATEYQQILSSGLSNERSAAIYDLLLSKPLVQSLKIFKKVWTFFNDHTHKYSVLQNPRAEESQQSLVKKDVLSLNYDVVEYLFGFIPIYDLKNCRLVSKQWDSAIRPVLRNRATIHFDSDSRNYRPTDFLNCFEKYIDPPFTSFKITTECKTWNILELDNFFYNWGKNIRKLQFDGIRLQDFKKNVTFKTFNLTRWIKQAPHLNTLKIICSCRCTTGEVELDQLIKLTTLSLGNCNLLVAANKDVNRIAPMSISMYSVSFKEGETVLKNFYLNDYIDFSRATKINLDDNGDLMSVLDMKRQVFNAEKLHLCTYINMCVENWKDSQGQIFFLFLRSCSLLEASRLKVKQLLFTNSTIDLSVLPKTIEKIHFHHDVEFKYTKPINLPHLNYLYLELAEKNSSAISNFLNCGNLVEVEFDGYFKNRFWTLNTDSIPKSVKRMKIINPANVTISGDAFQLNTLILEDRFVDRPFTAASNIVDDIKPKILVLSITDTLRLNTTDIIKFMLRNRQFEKLVVGCEKGLHLNDAFETSILSYFTDKEANYYEFENGLVQSLTKAEFESLTNLQALKQRFYPYDL